MKLVKDTISKIGIFRLTLFCFIYIAIASLAITFTRVNILKNGKANFDSDSGFYVLGQSDKNAVLLPIRKDGAIMPVFSAQSVLAVDLTSDAVLIEKNPDEPILPASTTKIATALVALDHYPLDKILKVNGISVEGQKMELVQGEEISVENLLYGLLVYSANDAAEVLAQNFPGGRDLFISLMNSKTRQLGLKNTSFSNPTGLDGDGHWTTANDLIKIAKVAMENPIFSEMVATREVEVSSIDGKYTHKMININKLLGSVDGVMGVKTGWTENAKENLVSYVKREDREVMIAVLGSQDRFGETSLLIDWVFANYEWGR